MKLLLVAVCIIAAAWGASLNVSPQLAAKRAQPALKHDEVRDGRGQFELSYSTAEGIEVHEKGRLFPTPDGKDEYLQIDGETRYTGPDGKLYITKYSAGLNGVQVAGEHLPVNKA